MASADMDNLLMMGFSQVKAEYALKKCGNVQAAVDWLEKNENKSDEEIAMLAAEADDNDETNPNIEPEALKPGEAAQSLVCNDCGKKFRSVAQAEFHGSKTQHVNFSESTEEIAPLTEEEVKEKMALLRRRRDEKNAAKSEEDKLANKRNEEIRRKSTKETQDMKEDQAKKEQIKEAAAKKKEKQAEVAAKERIRAKIAADKEERRLKTEKEKAEREGRAPPTASTPTVVPTVSAPAGPKAYAETRMRLTLPSGSNIQKSFPVDTTLFEVASAITQESGFEVASFTQNFPKKVFDTVDFGASLKELGLVPSTALVVK